MGQDGRLRRAEEIFEEAARLDRPERAAFLDRACSGDDQLRGRVETMLRREETATGVLATGPRSAPPAARPADALPAGATIGRYRVEREIGRGGMGVVYEARDERLDRVVAVKLLSGRDLDGQARERFLREARAAAALNHPNIVAVYDAGETSDSPYLVMERVDGCSLDARPPASLDEVIALADQVCAALEHAHARGLVHRDLKPANVLVTRSEGRTLAKLTDMGIALTCGAARLTRAGAIAGTPTYMAPEQALGGEIDGRADLYALGVMLYDWVAGRPPFEGDDALAIVSQHIHAPVVPPRAYRPDLPAGLEPLILRLLAKRTDERFATAAEVRRALAAVGSSAADAGAGGSLAIEGLARGRLVGRKRELARLEALWRAAVDGRCHLVLISGEPGVGKTRLANELTARARLDGALVLAGGCYENEATTPYLPFVEAVRRLARERSDEELSAALGDTAAEIARFAPEIESRLGPFPERPPLPPHEERLRLFDHVARFLRRLAGSRGLLLFVDDMQWADAGSLTLLHYLLRQLGSDRVLFLGTYREVELDRAHALSKSLVDWNRERLATRVRLRRLTREETGRMIATLLGSDGIPGEFVDSLHQETEGNPFFVEEIVKALVAEGGLVHEDSSWRRAKTGEFVLPQSVKAAIGSRLTRVSAACSEVLQTAAVLGKTFEFAELASVAPVSEDELLDVLDEATAAQLVAPGRGESFAFTHDKIREVLYDELNPIRRRRLHARIAEGLERLQAGGGEVAVEELAHHFIGSGDYAKGLLYAERAAKAARCVCAWDEALAMLTRARECAEALERRDEVVRLDETMGEVASARGDVHDAAEHLERALAGTTDPDRTNRLRCRIGEVYVIRGDPRGLEQVRLALERLDPRGAPREAARAMMVEARYAHLAGRLDRAAEVYRSALSLAEPTEDADLLVRLYSFFAGTLQHRGDLDESDAMAERCIAIGEREEILHGVMLGYEFLCENAVFRGRWAESVKHGETEEALARRVCAGERLGWTFIRGFAVHGQGRLAEAERLFRRAIEHCEWTGDRRAKGFMEIGLAACLTDAGRLPEALELAERATGEADEANLSAHRICGRWSLCRALLQEGRFDRAADLAREAVACYRDSGSLGDGLMFATAFAESLVRSGHGEEARSVLDEHAGIARRTKAEQRLGQNLRVRGLLAARENALDEAEAAFDEAAARLDAASSPLDVALTLADRARLHAAAGRRDRARDDRARARALVEDCGAAPVVLGFAGDAYEN